MGGNVSHKHNDFDNCKHPACSLARTCIAWRESVGFIGWARGLWKIQVTDTHTGAQSVLEPRKQWSG